MSTPAPAPSRPEEVDGARILVGVGGGIAAYKAAHVVRGLVASGADVHVLPTENSLRFVGSATWEALSGHPVLTSVFEDVDQIAHVRLGKEADLVLVVPATADLMARARAGRADDLLSATLLMAGTRVLLAPAMHSEMWLHPATVENVAVLRERGIGVLEPAVGRLTGPDSGPGRLPEPEAILDAARARLAAPDVADLSGRHVLVTAGGTREALDPVRYLANHSSGRQGWALAHAALARGAQVTLVAANVDLETPPGADRVDVTSAAELAAAVAARRSGVDVLVMAAAVADFTPSSVSGAKIKKSADPADPQAPTLELARTEDVLRAGVLAREQARRAAGAKTPEAAVSPQVIVGFAAETGDSTQTALAHARDKARRKGADLLVFNDLTGGVFGSERNAVAVLDSEGTERISVSGSKTVVAHAVLDEVSSLLSDVR
jgi:phosphopantothenoylcysteine decarboxylase/phosphopantothenate--cysteine ligase